MIRTTLCLTLAFAASPAVAQNFQSTTLLDKAVAGFTGQPIGATGGARTPVDTRLKLAACPMVSLAWRTDSHDSVVVTCPDPQWRIFVPVVATAAAPKPAVIVGPAAAPAAKPVIVIKRGDPVSVVAGDDGFAVTRDGIAMSDAGAGQRVLIRVEDGKPPIQAVAVEAGRATIAQ